VIGLRDRIHSTGNKKALDSSLLKLYSFALNHQLMANVSQSSFILFIGILLFGVGSCSKICDEGYEGTRCDVEIRERFEGNWNATDEPGNKVYVTTISKGTGVLDLLISNSFADSTFSRTVKATASPNSITIPNQRPDTSKIYVEGTGIIDNDDKRITWTYNLINKYDSPAVVTPYTGVWSK
jgi:hypothetical protein